LHPSDTLLELESPSPPELHTGMVVGEHEHTAILSPPGRVENGSLYPRPHQIPEKAVSSLAIAMLIALRHSGNPIDGRQTRYRMIHLLHRMSGIAAPVDREQGARRNESGHIPILPYIKETGDRVAGAVA